MPSTTRRQRRQPNRSGSSNRSGATQSKSVKRQPVRTIVHAAPEPVDYSLDYAYVRRDLLLIALLGGILLAAMIIASFVI